MQNKIELLKCSQRILDKYRKFVKGNKNDSDELIEKKILRNFILAEEKWREGNVVKRCFGKLEIIVDLRDMIVVNIHNNISSNKYNYINYYYKEQLNTLLGIEA